MDELDLENKSLGLGDGEKVGLNVKNELGLDTVDVGSVEGVIVELCVASELGLGAVATVDGDIVGGVDKATVGLEEGAHVG